LKRRYHPFYLQSYGNALETLKKTHEDLIAQAKELQKQNPENAQLFKVKYGINEDKTREISTSKESFTASGNYSAERRSSRGFSKNIE
jgi:hypothetical protein